MITALNAAESTAPRTQITAPPSAISMVPELIEFVLIVAVLIAPAMIGSASSGLAATGAAETGSIAACLVAAGVGPAASVALTTAGTKCGGVSGRETRSARNLVRSAHRHENSCCGRMPCRRATALISAPSAKLSATIAFLAARDSRLRPRPTPRSNAPAEPCPFISCGWYE